MLGLSTAVLTGCFETKQEFTINPDGSGKVVHECRFDEYDLGGSGDSLTSLTNVVRDFIQNSKGVDAWRDVTFQRLEDGRGYFRGTAYFRRLDALELHQQSIMGFSWTPGAGRTRILAEKPNERSSSIPDFTPDKPSGATNLTEAELAQKVRKQRQEYGFFKSMLTSTLGRMKQECVFHLPGTVQSAANFQKSVSGELSLRIEGAEMLSTLDKVMNDDEMLKAVLRSGTNQLDPNHDLIAIAKGPVQATVLPGDKPLFDYETELQAASEDFHRIQKQLNISAVAVRPAAAGELKNLELTAIRLSRPASGQKPQLFHSHNAGLDLSFQAELPGVVEGMTAESFLSTAQCDDGTTLMRSKNRQQLIAQLSADRTHVSFDVHLKAPPSGARTVTELAGQLQYRSEVGGKEIDLGFQRLGEGETGTNYGARIASIRRSSDQATHFLELKLSAPLADIKTVYLVVDGVRTALRRRTSLGDGRSTIIDLESRWPIPAKGRLVLERVGRIETYNVPFRVRNIPLPQLTAEVVK